MNLYILNMTSTFILPSLSVMINACLPQALTWSNVICINTMIFFMARQILVGRGLLIIGVLRSYSNTPHSVGHLRTSVQSDAETDNTQHSQETDIHSPSWFEPAIPASEQPQTHALVHVTTGTGRYYDSICVFLCLNYPAYKWLLLSAWFNWAHSWRISK